MILIIDNYDSFTYNLYQIVAQFGQDVTVIRNNQVSVKEVKQLKPAAIILSPGPGRPEDAGLCIPLIQALVRKEFNAGLLGVCLGHQAIGAALGSEVVQANEIAHGKSDWITHRGLGLYQNLSQPLKVGRYHSLVIKRSTLSKALSIEAENKNKLIMGIRHKNLPIYGVQFHPESILTPEGNLLLQQFLLGLKQKGELL